MLCYASTHYTSSRITARLARPAPNVIECQTSTRESGLCRSVCTRLSSYYREPGDEAKGSGWSCVLRFVIDSIAKNMDRQCLYNFNYEFFAILITVRPRSNRPERTLSERFPYEITEELRMKRHFWVSLEIDECCHVYLKCDYFNMPVKIYTEFQSGVCLRFCTFFSFLHEHLQFFVMHRAFPCGS